MQDILVVSGLSLSKQLLFIAGHSVPLREEHYQFTFVGSITADWCIQMQINYVLGKGACQSQQQVPISSRMYNLKVGLKVYYICSVAYAEQCAPVR